jgi:hypothetical protein
LQLSGHHHFYFPCISIPYKELKARFFYSLYSYQTNWAFITDAYDEEKMIFPIPIATTPAAEPIISIVEPYLFELSLLFST